MATHTHIIKQEEAQTETSVQLRAADPGSPAANQLWVNTTSNLLKAYSGGTTHVIGGGGGGGGSLQWIEDATATAPAPNPIVENSQRVYAFQAVLGQALYAAIRVPAGYIAGSQVFLRTTFYSPDSSGNVKIKTVTTLIRTGTDLITSTTNQRTSTNAAVTLGAGTVNIPQAVAADLTSSSGQVNGVAVTAGDILLVQLTRDTADTATSDAKVPVYGTEVTFS